MKYFQGLQYIKTFFKKVKPPIKTITNPISGKTITECNSKKDYNTSLNLVLKNFNSHKPTKTENALFYGRHKFGVESKLV